MAWKADNPATTISVAANGITTIDGQTVAADLQGVILATVSGSTGTSVSLSNPLPVVRVVTKTVQYGTINTATSGDNTLVAASGATRIKVIGFLLVTAGAVTVQLKSGTTVETGQTNLSGPISLAANGGWQDRGSTEECLFQTAASKSLVLNLSSAIQVSGYYSYLQE